jgi:hypothetical protein
MTRKATNYHNFEITLLKDRTHICKTPLKQITCSLNIKLLKTAKVEREATPRSLDAANEISSPIVGARRRRIIQIDFARPEGRNRLERQKCKGGLSLPYHQAAQLKT